MGVGHEAREYEDWEEECYTAGTSSPGLVLGQKREGGKENKPTRWLMLRIPGETRAKR
jgi:hypothetical protein